MAMTSRNNKKYDCPIMCTLDELVVQDHLVKTVESAIDWDFIYPLVESLYSKLERLLIQWYFFLT